MKVDEVDDGEFVRIASMVPVNHVVWGRIKKEKTNLKVSGLLYFTRGVGKRKKVKNGAKTELVFEFKHKIYNSLKEEGRKSTM